MTDPAVEAAQRAWDKNKVRSFSVQRIMAAREALAPLRDLHRPFDRRTSIYPIPNDPHTIVCRHCLGPIDWPCATARLIYREDEL